MQVLLLRLQAPMMAFGGTTVDQNRPTDAFPGASLLTGLFGNALGMHHREAAHLQRLQDRLTHAAGRLTDASPGARSRPSGVHRLTDFQTVDLGQQHLVDAGWTTHHMREDRAGGFSKGTHIRHREYLIDADYVVAVALRPADESPTLDHLAEALQQPARPLFLGRKSCIPSRPILAGRTDAETLRDALLGFDGSNKRLIELWSYTDEAPLDGSTRWVSDRRDWANQVHTGRRLVRHETLAEGTA